MRHPGRPSGGALRAPLAGATALALLGPEPVTELERTIARRVGPLRLPLATRPRGRACAGAPTGCSPAAGPPWVVPMARQGGSG